MSSSFDLERFEGENLFDWLILVQWVGFQHPPHHLKRINHPSLMEIISVPMDKHHQVRCVFFFFFKTQGVINFILSISIGWIVSSLSDVSATSTTDRQRPFSGKFRSNSSETFNRTFSSDDDQFGSFVRSNKKKKLGHCDECSGF